MQWVLMASWLWEQRCCLGINWEWLGAQNYRSTPETSELPDFPGPEPAKCCRVILNSTSASSELTGLPDVAKTLQGWCWAVPQFCRFSGAVLVQISQFQLPLHHHPPSPSLLHVQLNHPGGWLSQLPNVQAALYHEGLGNSQNPSSGSCWWLQTRSPSHCLKSRPKCDVRASSLLTLNLLPTTMPRNLATQRGLEPSQELGSSISKRGRIRKKE